MVSADVNPNTNTNTGKPDNLQVGQVDYLNFSDEIKCISCGTLDPISDATVNVFPIVKKFEVFITK